MSALIQSGPFAQQATETAVHAPRAAGRRLASIIVGCVLAALAFAAFQQAMAFASYAPVVVSYPTRVSKTAKQEQARQPASLRSETCASQACAR
jgi:hypothetical protein